MCSGTNYGGRETVMPGLFDKQKLYRGERLVEAYQEGEHFILYDLALVVENSKELIEGSTVDKVELVTGREGEPPILTSTLANAIVRVARGNLRDAKGKPKADDLPAVCYWKRVDTTNSFENQATVLELVEPYTGELPKSYPAWSFSPITMDDNPL